MSKDPRPAAVDGHVARIVSHASDIEQLLPTLPVDTPVDAGCDTCNARPGQPCKPVCEQLQRPGGASRSSGTSRPTERELLGWEDQLRRHANQLADLLVGKPARRWRAEDEPDDPWTYALGLADLLGHPPARPDVIAGAVHVIRRGTAPDRREWRGAVVALAGALVEAANGIQDGWHQLWRDRWRTDTRGHQVLDEGADADCTDYQAYLRQLETRVYGLRERIALTGPRLCAGDDCRHPAPPPGEGDLCDQCDQCSRSQRQCACGCGRPAPPRGQGATRDDCRQRRRRERLKGDKELQR